MAQIVTRERRVATRLSEIPDGQLACRAGRHMWALDALQVGVPLPAGLTAVPQHDGSYQLDDTCDRCGKRRTVTTLPNHVYDIHADYSYADPPDWVKLSLDLDVTKRMLRAENIARNAGRLFR